MSTKELKDLLQLLTAYGVTNYQDETLKLELAPSPKQYAEVIPSTREEAVSSLPDNFREALNRVAPGYEKLGIIG